MDHEISPGGGHRKKTDPRWAQKIQQGGKKAQQIAHETHAHHQQKEVPQAEEELLKDLKTIK